MYVYPQAVHRQEYKKGEKIETRTKLRNFNLQYTSFTSHSGSANIFHRREIHIGKDIRAECGDVLKFWVNESTN